MIKTEPEDDEFVIRIDSGLNKTLPIRTPLCNDINAPLGDNNEVISPNNSIEII